MVISCDFEKLFNSLLAKFMVTRFRQQFSKRHQLSSGKSEAEWLGHQIKVYDYDKIWYSLSVRVFWKIPMASLIQDFIALEETL